MLKVPVCNHRLNRSPAQVSLAGFTLSKFATIMAALAAVFVSIACAGEHSPGPGNSAAAAPAVHTNPDALNVVATVSPITSIVENIGGTRINLRGVVPEGVNSHTFEPAPSVASTLAEADLVFLNGLFLEEPTLEMAQANLKTDASIVSLGDQTVTRKELKFDFSFPESGGYPNPHLWPDPILALRYAEIVRDTLVGRDPDDADYYNANYDEFANRIAALDSAIRTAVPTIPMSNRKLLTYHDSWAYFADRYGLTVIGAVQPSDFSEPSAREVADLIHQIKTENIPAVFGSEVFPSDVMRTIAGESGAAYVDELSDDDLPGVPGDPDHSYFGLAVSNLRTMIPALGGDATALDDVDLSLVFEGTSNAVYPQ
jgi:ABC-type Zn uptake system ZnuABC Zn-binding protein ZnuA